VLFFKEMFESENLDFIISAEKTDNDSEYEPVSISSLPFEVLVHLTKFLDPLRFIFKGVTLKIKHYRGVLMFPSCVVV